MCAHKVKKMPPRCTVPAATAHRTMVVVVDGVCMCDDDEWGNLDDPTVQSNPLKAQLAQVLLS